MRPHQRQARDPRALGYLLAPQEGKTGIDIPNIRKPFPSKRFLLAPGPERIPLNQQFIEHAKLKLWLGHPARSLLVPACFRRLAFRVL